MSSNNNNPPTTINAQEPIPEDMRLPVGTTLYKEFPPHGWFWGEVQGMSQHNFYYSVRYSDGDVEELTHAEVLQYQRSGTHPRKSHRKRTSTLTYIDGQAVKKINNYEMKGVQYLYNNNNHDDGGYNGKPPQRKKSRKQQQQQPKKKRVLSAQEVARATQKEAVQERIQAKQAKKRRFIGQHRDVLSPFCEEKVLDKLCEETTSIELTSPEFMQPDGIQGDLRDYQLQGLNWMAQMFEQNMSMILGDEMGLGKTLQTISLICLLQQKFKVTGTSLVICPLSVLDSWSQELERWAPQLKYERLHGPDASIPNLDRCDVLVTSYEMTKVKELQFFFQRNHFDLLILDEGHRIKGYQTQLSLACRKINAECRLILTGTPLANDLVELYSLLNFMEPTLFTTDVPFREAFNLTMNVVDNDVLKKANDLLQVFMLRRLKSTVEKLMPLKVETKVFCPLSKMQIWWYKALLLKDMSKLESGGPKAHLLNNLLMQLRKCCLHPYLFPGAEDMEGSTTLEELVGSSGKLAVLDKLLRSLYQNKHRAVLFSQFTGVLDLLEDYCQLRGWNYCRFDGGTQRARRNYIIKRFNAPDSPNFLFLMSTRSGGMGLNLQTADTCILYDSDWNPQPDLQAMARVHRIGQTKTVHVYRLVTDGTVEHRMLQRAEKKLYLDTMVTRNAGEAQDMEEDEAASRGKLMDALLFGCNAVFGANQSQHALPSDSDIDVLTDRTHKKKASDAIKSNVERKTDDFDATQQFSSTMTFEGVDFRSIREQNRKSVFKSSGDILEGWQKRKRTSRIKVVNGLGSGYGSSAVPVLALNDYELQQGEQSVFSRELSGRAVVGGSEKKKERTFKYQDFCQACGKGCRRSRQPVRRCAKCPVALHERCAGDAMRFSSTCSHHRCAICEKSSSKVGGFLYVCNACPNAYCEDHLPDQSTTLHSGNPRMEALGYHLKHGVYIHCSKMCQEAAIIDLDYKPELVGHRNPCPPPLELSDYFGGDSQMEQTTSSNYQPETKHFKEDGCGSVARTVSPDSVENTNPQTAHVRSSMNPALLSQGPSTSSQPFAARPKIERIGNKAVVVIE